MKQNSNKIFVIILLFIFYGCNSGPQQVTLYVGPHITDQGTGTPDSPMKLEEAISMATPGTLILLKEGEYKLDKTLRMKHSGTQENPIRIQALNRGKVILNGRYIEGGNVNSPCMFIAGDYWHVKDIEFTGAMGGGVIIQGSHNRFECCDAHHTGGTGFSVGLNHGDTTNIDGERAAYNVFINCDAYMNYDWHSFYFNKNSPGTHADGFGCKLRSGKGNKFYECRAWKNSDDNWDLFESGGGVEIVNCWNWHAAIWSDFVEMHLDRTGEVLTEELFAGDGNGFKLGGNHTADAGDGCTNRSLGLNVLRNCVSFGNKEKGIDQNNHQDGTIIEHCLSFNNGVNIRYWKEPNPGKTNVFRNTILFGTGGEEPVMDIDFISENNSWDLGLSFSEYDFITLDEAEAAAPRQADGSLPARFARPFPASQAIDRGIMTCKIVSEKDGIDLPAIPYDGAAPDLGPYEYIK